MCAKRATVLVFRLKELNENMIPPNLEGKIDANEYRSFICKLRHEPNCCCRPYYFGLIGDMIRNKHCAMVCIETNKNLFCGRKVFEWKSSQTLWVYPDKCYCEENKQENHVANSHLPRFVLGVAPQLIHPTVI